MTSREAIEDLVFAVGAAKARFEAGCVPDGLDALLERLAGLGLDGLRQLPGEVRGLVDEGPLPASYPMLGVRFGLVEVLLRLHLMKAERTP